MTATATSSRQQTIFTDYTQTPDPFPAPWASAYGEEADYGYWQELTVAATTQRFYWIHPGRFEMGSPESEPERYDDETQHPVTLTRGFWLADTAVTQALWQTVMGENPSRFSSGEESDNRPVEQVSWEDCKVFLERLNGLYPHLNARLPSEAEWEYACRAGTTTPFSFGCELTTDQANYNGNYPYNQGGKGVHRQTTVDAKHFAPNPWGLYQMHGNVWEWCGDWYRKDYEQDSPVDPLGPPEGSRRVLRGGGWFSGGRSLRAADRGRGRPGSADDSIGLRLALGQIPSSQRD